MLNFIKKMIKINVNIFLCLGEILEKGFIVKLKKRFIYDSILISF